MKLRLECRCGGVVDVEDDDHKRAQKIAAQWEQDHRCIPMADEPKLGRQGVGFALTDIPRQREWPDVEARS